MLREFRSCLQMSRQTQNRLIDILFDTLQKLPTQLHAGNVNLEPAKSALLTLHALFPSVFLPALDMLDRNLVTRLVLNSENHTFGDQGMGKSFHTRPMDETLSERSVYYVRSNAPPHPTQGRFSDRLADEDLYYEVRVGVWNCTCASFTFAALNAAKPTHSPSSTSQQRTTRGKWDGVDPIPAGLRGRYVNERTQDIPICKHLLACSLANGWSAAEGMIEVKHVSKDEMAGWAAQT